MKGDADLFELVELGPLTDEDWANVQAGEQEPFGPVGAGLEWRPKERHIGLRVQDGRLVAVAGAMLVTVEVADAPFEVVGLGSLIVTRSLRGRGLMRRVVDPLLRLAEQMGPDRAMIFCRPELVGLYGDMGFIEITAPVWADQARGRIEMPLASMWRALRRGAEWPAGRVEVRGLPF